MPEQKRAFNEGDIIIMEEMTKVENANDRVLVAGCACIIFSSTMRIATTTGSCSVLYR